MQVGGIFPMPKATEVQAQDVLRAYQFNWDDDMVRAPQHSVHDGTCRASRP